MDADTGVDRRRAYSRRTFLAGVGATAGVAVGVGTATAAQESPTGTAASDQPRRGVVEYYAEFGGEDEQYTNQYLLITDETSEQTSADAVENCDAADWSAEQTAPYEVSILQQLDQETEMIKGTDFYANSSGPPFEIGSTWGITDATRCGDFLALTIVPVDPDEEGLDLANVTEAGGTETTEMETTETGTPGFGVGAALAGIAGGAAAYLRRD